ncbi:hypothetical protein [Desulfobotulus alkaliphilus]|nr:hypothetical protein [Desulfobotulus alkaliphilus]
MEKIVLIVCGMDVEVKNPLGCSIARRFKMLAQTVFDVSGHA